MFAKFGAGRRRADAKAAILGGNSADLVDFLDIDEKIGRDDFARICINRSVPPARIRDVPLDSASSDTAASSELGAS